MSLGGGHKIALGSCIYEIQRPLVDITYILVYLLHRVKYIITFNQITLFAL